MSGVDEMARLIQHLRSLPRYESSIAGGCECCGSWVEHELDAQGDWLKYDDVHNVIVKALQAER